MVQEVAPVNDEGDKVRTLIGARLREERVRLKLSQTEFARLGASSKRTQIDWEAGSRSPTAEFLALIAEHGVDVIYVLTGQRSAEKAPNLSPRDIPLVYAARRLPDADHAALVQVVEAMSRHAA